MLLVVPSMSVRMARGVGMGGGREWGMGFASQVLLVMTSHSAVKNPAQAGMTSTSKTGLANPISNPDH
jgi:hypothetical protein